MIVPVANSAPSKETKILLIERDEYREEYPYYSLGEEELADRGDPPESVRPKVQVDDRRGDQKGRSEDEEGARDRARPPAPGAHDPCGAITAIDAHISPSG